MTTTTMKKTRLTNEPYPLARLIDEELVQLSFRLKTGARGEFWECIRAHRKRPAEPGHKNLKRI